MGDYEETDDLNPHPPQMIRNTHGCRCSISSSPEFGMRKDIAYLSNEGCHEMDAGSCNKPIITPNTIEGPISNISGVHASTRCSL